MAKDKMTKDALKYHSEGRKGKIEVIPSKPTATQRDLSLAYSPGVAAPCLEIEKDSEIGNLGALASKPVMEGKGLLFKIYADIDCFDIELDTEDVDEFIRTVKILEPTFGGINLEDIKAPACFEIEERLKKELNIPVMHDDQHGTAIISGAALLNALEIVKKDISDVRIVVNGAGASAISCTKIYLSLGAKKENIFMYDSRGLIHGDRDNLNGKKPEFINNNLPASTSLTDVLKGADVFIGLSKGNVLSPEMIKGMGSEPIIFAMANPTPEIDFNLAKETRPDCIMATGRSDYPNQVNNVLGFPFIFRGALDVRATEINEDMKIAAVHALADLAKKPVPDIVNMAYNNVNLTFGKDYIIPKPVDPRLISTVAPAVARAAMDAGIAQKNIKDWEAYESALDIRLGNESGLSQIIETKAKQDVKRIAFTDGEELNVLKAAQIAYEEGIAIPILIGDEDKINAIMEEHFIRLPDVEIINPKKPKNKVERDRLKSFVKTHYNKRNRKGITPYEAQERMERSTYHSIMLVETGYADAVIGGLTERYPAMVRPALKIVGAREGVSKVASVHILNTKTGPLFLADTTVNHHLTPEDIANITELVAEQVRIFNIEPRISLITYSNFGSVPDGESAMLMREATRILHDRHPDWIVDGEMQAHLAMDQRALNNLYPFSKLAGHQANVLIFPNLSSANIAYNLLNTVGEMNVIGPILLGMKKPIHILQLQATVRQIVDMVGIAAIDAQGRE